MLTEHLAPLWTMAERVANRALNAAQKKAKKDKRKVDLQRQVRRACGEDTTEEEGGPPTVIDEST